MIRRYLIGKPRMADMDHEPDGEDYMARTVYDTSGEMMDTGLLDAHGNPILAQYEMDRIGYIWREESEW